MRLTLLIFFAFLSTVIYSQTATVDLYYGYNAYTNNYYNQLSTINNIDIKKPFSIISIGMTEYLKKRSYQSPRFSFFIPSKVTVSDTLKFKITGFSFDHNYAFDLIKNSSDKSKKKLLYLMIGIGYTAGQVYLTKNDFYKQKNPFFAPKLTLQPRVRIGKIIFSLTFDYRYDVSKDIWKKTKFNPKEVATINGFKHSSITGLFSIGYCLN